MSCIGKDLRGLMHHGLMHLHRYNGQIRVFKGKIVRFTEYVLHLQVMIEVPYVLAQSLAYVVITYPMIGYSWTSYKVFWYLYSMFCTLLYFTYMGMMIVSFTPTHPAAVILQSSFNTVFNLFSGFIIPQPVSFISIIVISYIFILMRI